jgi:hypothetical protein
MAFSLQSAPVKRIQASLNQRKVVIKENYGLNSATGFWWLVFTFDHHLEKEIEVRITNSKYKDTNTWTLEITKCHYLGISSKEDMVSFDMVDEVVNAAELARLQSYAHVSNEKLCQYIERNIIPIITQKIKYTKFKPQFSFFLSHKSKDKPVMTSFAAGFEFLGYNTWLDKNEIAPGMPLLATLQIAVDGCDCFIAWLNKEYMESDYCRAELLYAKEQGKILLLFGDYGEIKEYVQKEMSFLAERLIFNPVDTSFFEILRRMDEVLFNFETLPI